MTSLCHYSSCKRRVKYRRLTLGSGSHHKTKRPESGSMDAALTVNPNCHPTNGLGRRSMMLEDCDTMFLRIVMMLTRSSNDELLS